MFYKVIYKLVPHLWGLQALISIYTHIHFFVVINVWNKTLMQNLNGENQHKEMTAQISQD